MKIGIDTQAACGNGSGLAVYTRQLTQAMQTLPRNGLELRFLNCSQQRDWNTVERLVWENIRLSRKIGEEKIDILHVPAFAPPFRSPCKLVVTVHDLIGMTFPNQMGWPSRFYWGRWLPACVRKADALIADSCETQKEIVRLLNVSESKVSVIYPSGHEGFYTFEPREALEGVKRRFGVRDRYFLTVGTLEPRKNMERVLQAFFKFLEYGGTGNSYQLVMVGLTEFAHGKYVRSLADSGLKNKDRVILTGYVQKEELNQLYSGSEALLFPSLCEGFGIPVLEAMAAGTPVLTSRTSSLPEVAGEAAYYVDPLSVDEISSGIRSLAENPSLRQDLIRKGFEQTKRFSWTKTAEETLTVYRKVAHG